MSLIGHRIHIGAVALGLLAMFAISSISGCANDADGTPAAKRSGLYSIVTTIGMVNDIVRNVAGDKASVSGIIGEGVDPHLYKPTRNDVAALMQADVVFYSGLMLEGKMADTLIKIAGGGKSVFAVTELIDEAFLLEPEDMEGHFDPHVWMDVQGWIKAVEAVAVALGKFDESNADYYQANAKKYMDELAGLDEYVRESIASVPQKSRVLVTAHDAFNYFGRAYGLQVMGIQGLSTESEAGLEDLNKLIDFIVERDIQAVFVESSVSDKNVRALIEGAKSRGKTVKIGGELFSDAMGEPGTYEGTYVGMIDHNATIVTRSLGGQAPTNGLNGKLNVAEE